MLGRLLLAEVVCLVVAVGCNPPERDRGEVELKMYTWWTAGGEKEALDVLKEENLKKYPNVRVKTNEAKNAEASFAQLDAELMTFSPPDTFQANGGSKLLSRVIFNTGNPSKVDPRLKPIDDVFDVAGTNIWSEILDPLIKVHGSFYGVPLNIHRINNLYFSVPKLAEVMNLPDDASTYDAIRAQLPKSFEGFFKLVKTASEHWKSRGMEDPRPIGLGMTDIWTLEELAFENLLPSIALANEKLGTFEQRQAFFETYWNGTRNPDSREDREVIEATLATTQELWTYVHSFGEPGVSSSEGKWSGPFDKLVDPDSAVTFVVMGDWATGYLNENAYEPKNDYGVVPFPGTEKLFIFTSDTLPLTSTSRHPEETKDFLATALSIEAQLEFSAKKGSVPAVLLDSAASKQLTEAQRETIVALSDSSVKKSLAMSGMVTPDVEPDLYRKALKAMLDEKTDPVYGRDLVHHTLENHYWMLTRWTYLLNEANQE
jgi:glucose/mannose transport system substrate-binding protein